MKVERRANSVFIAHNGLTIFADRVSNEAYRLKVNKKVYDERSNPEWITVGEMEVSIADFKKYVEFLGEIAE